MRFWSAYNSDVVTQKTKRRYRLSCFSQFSEAKRNIQVYLSLEELKVEETRVSQCLNKAIQMEQPQPLVDFEFGASAIQS